MTSVEVDIPSFDGFNRSYPLTEPLNIFPDFEELFAMTHVEELRPATLTVFKDRFSPKEIEEAMIGFDLMADLHHGRRRRSGAEEGTHPGLVGLWHIKVNPDATVDEYVAAVLHDTEEDCGENETSVGHHLINRNYPADRALRVARVVEGLTRDDPDNQTDFIKKIIGVSEEIPEIPVIPIRALDTAHTVKSYEREIQNPASDPTRARRYLDRKAFLVLAMAESHAPAAINTQILRHTIVGLNEKLALRGQSDQAARRHASTPIPK